LKGEVGEVGEEGEGFGEGLEAPALDAEGAQGCEAAEVRREGLLGGALEVLQAREGGD